MNKESNSDLLQNISKLSDGNVIKFLLGASEQGKFPPEISDCITKVVDYMNENEVRVDPGFRYSLNISLFDRFIRREDPTRGQTTIHGYHKRIKPYINEALRLGLIEDTPYRVFKDKHGRYKTRQPLTMDELQSIRNIELNDRQLQKVRDQFIFQCYTGLSWVDLYMFDYDRCTVEHNGVAYIDGERIKTGTKFYTPILTPAMEILKKYDYKFTVPTVQSFNRSLKIIAELIGLKKPLTSHIARHTFATTVVLANDVPIETLSKMLGHTKVSVTQVYAKILNSSVEKHAEKLNSII